MLVDQHVYRMNEAQEEWLNYYIDSGDDIRAVEVAYPNVAEENRSSKASKLRAALSSEIDRLSRKRYTDLAPKMINVIKDIALNTSGKARPSEQLKAASEFLSRAGHDQAQVLEIKEPQTHKQLQDKLAVLTANLPKEELAKLGLIEQPKGQDNERETKH